MGDVQAHVQDLVERRIGSGDERGVQVAAYVGGQLLVDVVAGVADPGTGRPVEHDTPFYNYSIGKGAMSTLVHQQVDCGTFDYDTRVADLWPAFTGHGKERITVRHVLTHAAGVPALPAGCTVEDICSWSGMTAALERAEPWWEPGTQVGYHAYTFGYLAGEIVRRATGRPLADVLRDDLAAPLGHPDEIWFGVPPEQTARLAVLEDAPSEGDWTAQLPPDLPMFKASPAAVFPTAALGNDPRVIAADIPAGGKVSARAIAKMYAALLGEVDGVRLVSQERLAELSAVGSSGVDLVFGNDSTWALGYAMGLPGVADDSRSVFGMAGAGGSWAGADVARGLSLAVTKNVLSNDFETVEAVARVLTAAVDGPG